MATGILAHGVVMYVPNYEDESVRDMKKPFTVYGPHHISENVYSATFMQIVADILLAPSKRYEQTTKKYFQAQ